MIRAIVKHGDGIGRKSWLRSVVKSIQQGLDHWDVPLEIDGRFGRGTKKAVKTFQDFYNVQPTGIADKNTWNLIDPYLPGMPTEVATSLNRFRGDLEWVHQQEGHRGRPYWPGGGSGITLDPGVDLGHVNEDLVRTFYQPFLNKKQMVSLEKVFGIKGSDARRALSQIQVIRGIRISPEQGMSLMHYMARPYWNGIVNRFPALARKDTPPSVQTALLSLAYNRGVFNRHLESLAGPLGRKQWDRVAESVGGMQQSHSLRGIRIRRRQERNIIRAELEFIKHA
ncbi:MAG: peptidoglycan-binding protein [bacterium]